MNRPLKATAVLALVLAASVYALVGPTSVRAARPDSERALLQKLVDHQAIEDLMTAYGVTLDHRDFAAFGQLFAEDATYGGSRGEPTRGRAAIQAQLDKTLTRNVNHLPEPGHHVYFDPLIEIDGDHATGQTLGAYAVPDPSASFGWRLTFFITYEDEFVKRDGHWLFQQRRLVAAKAPSAAQGPAPGGQAPTPALTAPAR
jgi:hypothetical protein